MYPADCALGLAIAFIVACNLTFGPRIELARVAMQWGRDGEPTWYAPKWLAMWGMVFFIATIRLFIWLTATYSPQNVHGAGVGIVMTSIVVAGAHLFILMKARTAR